MPPESARGLIASVRQTFERAGIGTAALDARLLLQHAAGLTHEEIVADPEMMIDSCAARRFSQMVERRSRCEPVSRIIGSREFHGRPFEVTPAVLDPRPDTETLIDAAFAIRPRPRRLLDLGTGSGAIIITLLAEWPEAMGVGSDLSAAALAIAGRNAVRHGIDGRLSVVHCSWFDAVSGEFDLIVSNPPYIPRAEIGNLPGDVRCYDPLLALDGGPEGLSAYLRIASGAGRHLAAEGQILIEIGAGQADSVKKVFGAAGFSHHIDKRDLGGHVRCLGFRKA